MRNNTWAHKHHHSWVPTRLAWTADQNCMKTDTWTTCRAMHVTRILTGGFKGSHAIICIYTRGRLYAMSSNRHTTVLSDHVAQALQPDQNNCSPPLHVCQLLHRLGRCWLMPHTAWECAFVYCPSHISSCHRLPEIVSLCVVQSIFPVATHCFCEGVFELSRSYFQLPHTAWECLYAVAGVLGAGQEAGTEEAFPLCQLAYLLLQVHQGQPPRPKPPIPHCTHAALVHICLLLLQGQLHLQ